MESGNNLPNPGTYPGGDRQQFCVSWNSHQSNMHSAFPKLLSSEQFVDVTLACDGGSIKCHKVVLSACSDYLERLLLEIPCTHPVIFLRDMKMWELQALVEFMYRGEVYVEQQQLATLMQAAEVLQVRGLSTQGCDNSVNESNTQSCESNAPVTPSTPTHGDSNFKAETSSNDGSTSDFLACTTMASTGNNSSSITPPVSQNPNSSNFVNMEHSEALQHLEKALSACEATLTETTGMVKMEPDEQFVQQQDVKPYSISMVSSNNCNPSSPFPAIEDHNLEIKGVDLSENVSQIREVGLSENFSQPCEEISREKKDRKVKNRDKKGYQRRQRRSEEELKQASDMVARGMTFQVASEKYKIPISTIRFYMVRKGILQRRKRGRGSSNLGMNSQPSSPASPPYHMMNYRLPESLNSSLP